MDEEVTEKAKEIQRQAMAAKNLQNIKTQIAISDMFVKKYGGEWSYNYNFKLWMHWTGKYWELDEKEEIRNVVQEFLKEYLVYIPNHYNGKDLKDEISFIIRLNTAKGVKDILELAKTRLTRGINEYNKEPRYFNLQNGTFDLTTYTLIPHNKDHLISKIAIVEYNKDADCPLWKEHINTICKGDPDLINNVQEILAYSLQGVNPNEIFSIWTGKGRNGKGATLKTIQAMYGNYAVSINPSCLMEAGNAAGSDRTDMNGARLIIASEPSKTAKEARCSLDTGFIKMATGNDRISARELYCKGIKFDITGLIIVVTNELPKINDVTTALWDRIWTIPFNHYFEEKDRDPKIKNQFLGESAGIFNWLLKGLERYQKAGGKLKKCKVVVDANADYRAEEDWFMPFINTLITDDPKAEMLSSIIYEDYQKWFKGVHSGNVDKMLTLNKFSRQMGKRFATRHSDKGTLVIGIKDPLQKMLEDAKAKETSDPTPAWSQKKDPIPEVSQ
jgi:putative DNA primase/helicase